MTVAITGITAALLSKSARQASRDLLGLAITVLTAPLFVLFYSLIYGDSDVVPFETYVPSLLIFAVIMLIFSSAMSIAREVEGGTLERLRMSPMGPLHYLLATSLFQGLLGAASVGLTFLSATLLGFQSAGSILLAMLVTALAALACIGLGVWVASLAKSVNQAFLIASVFMFLLLLFSGAVFPLPELSALILFGVSIGPLDLLPTVHAVNALSDVLILGKGFMEILFSLLAMTLLSALFFALGWWRFARKQGNFLSRGAR